MRLLSGAAFGILLVIFVVIAARRVFTRRGRGALGPAAIGSVYDMMNKDKRAAVEIVVEGRAEERDPEDKDGNLPDLARGKRGRPPDVRR